MSARISSKHLSTVKSSPGTLCTNAETQNLLASKPKKSNTNQEMMNQVLKDAKKKLPHSLTDALNHLQSHFIK